MLTINAIYGEPAPEFIEQLERLASVDEVMNAMQALLGRFGLEFFCFNTFPQAKQRFEDVMLASRLPPEWLKLYAGKDYVHVDPSVRLCKRTVHPFEWKDAPFDPEREPGAVEVVQRATDFGLSRGFLVPIPGPAGCEGDVWMGGCRPELTAQIKPLLHLVALYAFDRVRRLQGDAASDKPHLTEREREVLAWASHGKSAWEIGEILSIAKRTVDEHVQSAFRKLGAVNRTQAVAIAVRERLIDL